MIVELNRLLYKFLWNGTDKVTRLSTINEFEKGGLKMIDLECMIKSLRLAWFKRIFSENEGTWKNYLRHLLLGLGGLFFFSCNFNIKDYTISSLFYSEILTWWSEFRENFASTKDWRNIIWNYKEIRINNSPIFYKNFFDSGIVLASDLMFNLNSTESFSFIKSRVDKTNFLTWAGLRQAVPREFKNNTMPRISSPSFVINNNVFDITKKKSKHYYSLLINKKAQFPSAFNKLQSEFHFSIDSLQKVFMLPHKVALEPYVKAFQYKILNSILYTNTKLYKIGFSTCNKCTFCQLDLETLHHLLYSCPHSKTFWNEFEQYWFSITKERICLSRKDIIVGIITRSCPLLNYLLIIAKLYLWECRRNQTFPNVMAFKFKVQLKYETELYIACTSNNMNFLKEKWAAFEYS